MRARLPFGLLLAGALAACANGPRREAPRDAAPPLLAPASVGAPLQVQQILHAAYGSDESTLQCVVSDDAETLSVVCLTAMGQRVFTLDYDGRELKAQRAPFAPDAIDPARIVADLQLAYWPLAALQPAWQRAGYAVSEPRPGLRRVVRDGRLYAEVHEALPALVNGRGEGWPARVWLVNLAYGYALDIETQAAAE
ncbi:DUF3261 domain-containing protein [Solimonas soli]|uniref:DUF3261 domain-containing protein n=1 Tax=Solimonas soli TaxID=413479 RepID=UPI0006851693|nr:DUF3261 domain-containing protein [Solimonas soli]